MTKPVVSTTGLILCSLMFLLTSPGKAEAQSPALLEMYGRGVHAYFAGRRSEAYDYLSQAIDNGLRDPRAYYFRGIIAAESGRPEEAESDWQAGAKLEARGQIVANVGRSLARVQGSTRLKLEQIRQRARVEASAQAAARSEARYGEIRQAEGRVLQTPPASVDAPPTPPAADDDNPFRDDVAESGPTVDAEDALDGALESARAEATADAADTDDAAADPADDGDPFSAPADDVDPFGEAPSDDDDDGGDPFAPADGDEDPFEDDDLFGN